MRYRPMQPNDVRESVEIIAKHPVISSRYGSTIVDLAAAWLRLLSSGAGSAWVFFAEEDPRAPICFVGVGAIVNDDFVRELKLQPHFWLGPELTKRLLRGDSPLLTEKQLRDANSRGGLNQIVWEGCPRREFETHPELYRFAMDAFIHVHRGYLWKEVISVAGGERGAAALGAEDRWIVVGRRWGPLRGLFAWRCPRDRAKSPRRWGQA